MDVYQPYTDWSKKEPIQRWRMVRDSMHYIWLFTLHMPCWCYIYCTWEWISIRLIMWEAIHRSCGLPIKEKHWQLIYYCDLVPVFMPSIIQSWPLSTGLSFVATRCVYAKCSNMAQMPMQRISLEKVLWSSCRKRNLNKSGTVQCLNSMSWLKEIPTKREE